MKTITINGFELISEQAHALPLLLKRISWSDIHGNAVSEDEFYLIRDALYLLQKALAGYGYAPR